MSWGQELWDQYDNLSNHTHKGVEFLDKYGSFIKERCAIEAEYACKLRRLVKNHQLKKKPEDEKQYSYIKAFTMMLQEIQDLAGQHEVIAEEMLSTIVKEVYSLVKDLKDERKRYLTDGQKHQSNLQIHLQQLDKSKRAYEKAYKEAEKAQDNYQKVDADLNLSRAEVEKAKQQSNMKTQLCDEAKTDYANQLQKANDAQRIFYCDLMPKVFVQLQAMEERRILCISTFIKNSAIIHRNVLPIIDKCIEGIINAGDSINPSEDTLLVIDRYKSGNIIPEDFPFEDLSNPRPPSETSQGSNTLHYSNSITSKDTIRGTLSGARFKSRKGLFSLFGTNKSNFDENKDDYADLPPIQRKKQIKRKLETIQAQINQETAVRDGLMKMKVAYEQNNALGDPTTIEGQLTENGHKMEKLQNELRKFQNYLNEANGSLGTSPINQRKANRNSLSEPEDSLSRSASDSSVGQNNQNKTTTSSSNNSNISNNISNNNINNNNNNNINNGSTPKNTINHLISNHNTDIEHSKTNINDGNDENSSIQDNEFIETELEDVDECDGEADFLPALGKAKALYPFDAENEGSITMKEGEEFDLVEIDQGDGWTRVRRYDFEEGFVPTSYIEIELYSNNQNNK